jgi:hypothetical protein
MTFLAPFMIHELFPYLTETASGSHFLQRCPNCGERGSMREKGIGGCHAEAASLGLGSQPETAPFVNASASIGTYTRNRA